MMHFSILIESPNIGISLHPGSLYQWFVIFLGLPLTNGSCLEKNMLIKNMI